MNDETGSLAETISKPGVEAGAWFLQMIEGRNKLKELEAQITRA